MLTVAERRGMGEGHRRGGERSGGGIGQGAVLDRRRWR